VYPAAPIDVDSPMSIDVQVPKLESSRPGRPIAQGREQAIFDELCSIPQPVHRLCQVSQECCVSISIKLSDCRRHTERQAWICPVKCILAQVNGAGSPRPSFDTVKPDL